MTAAGLAGALVVRGWTNRLHVFDVITGRFLCGRLAPLDTTYDIHLDALGSPGFDTCRTCRAAFAKARGA